jgi:hypothetical protein
VRCDSRAEESEISCIAAHTKAKKILSSARLKNVLQLCAGRSLLTDETSQTRICAATASGNAQYYNALGDSEKQIAQVASLSSECSGEAGARSTPLRQCRPALRLLRRRACLAVQKMNLSKESYHLSETRRSEVCETELGVDHTADAMEKYALCEISINLFRTAKE